MFFGGKIKKTCVDGNMLADNEVSQPAMRCKLPRLADLEQWKTNTNVRRRRKGTKNALYINCY